jgi:hypothetical protein
MISPPAFTSRYVSRTTSGIGTSTVTTLTGKISAGGATWYATFGDATTATSGRPVKLNPPGSCR